MLMFFMYAVIGMQVKNYNFNTLVVNELLENVKNRVNCAKTKLPRENVEIHSNDHVTRATKNTRVRSLCQKLANKLIRHFRKQKETGPS